MSVDLTASAALWAARDAASGTSLVAGGTTRAEPGGRVVRDSVSGTSATPSGHGAERCGERRP
jgi:hypothetical protein